MKIFNTDTIDELYDSFCANGIWKRRLVHEDIAPLLHELGATFDIVEIGRSENGIPIFSVTMGTGNKKVLIWSQMHGNESTGTKSLFDLFGFLESSNTFLKPIADDLLSQTTIRCIVMLNPDGALQFTRENAHGIDLNRDATDRKAIESQILRDQLESFDPEFCFNLHDQRSIFNVSGTGNPATLSFLAPSEEISRQLTEGRKRTMSVIVAMNSLLQEIIPGHIGRYTDEYYPTATGDNFQKLGYSTILIEAGHYRNDYARNTTRKFNTLALIQGLHFIATSIDFTDFKPYFDIPNNDSKFLDAIYTDVSVATHEGKGFTSVGVQYVFEMVDGKIIRKQKIERTGDLSSFYTYNVINAEKKSISELKLSNS